MSDEFGGVLKSLTDVSLGVQDTLDNAVLEERTKLKTYVTSFVSMEESIFGAEDDGMQELEDRTGRDRMASTLHIGNEPDSICGFDACHEYGRELDCDADDSNDDDADEPCFLGAPILPLDVSNVAASFEGSQRSRDPGYAIYVLGKTYDALHDYAPRRSDENSLFWFTYRFDFPEIVPYRITTDAGWGCMLRSAQMMLGQALRMHYKDRHWRPPQAIAQRRHDSFMMKMLTWFADFPSKTDCTFSLHNMVAAGLAKYETLPGEWYGPSKVSYVMRDLCTMHAEWQAKEELKTSSGMPSIFRVHVAAQGTVYKDAVNALMRKNQTPNEEMDSNERETTNVPLSHPLDPMYSEFGVKAPSAKTMPWETSLLLLIPLRLGLQNFNQDYAVQLAHVFSLRQSVGVLGGRPRGARWFYGATSDGAKLYGLDPHTIQPCPERRKVMLPKGQTKLVVSLTSEYIRSVHTTNPECINLNRLDPSLALGFYCRDQSDFFHLCDALLTWKAGHPTMPDLFAVADNMPDYSANASHAMHEMLSMSLADGMDDTENDDAGDDEDEYVLL
jgi:cysteine protease ATG4